MGVNGLHNAIDNLYKELLRSEQHADVLRDERNHLAGQLQTMCERIGTQEPQTVHPMRSGATGAMVEPVAAMPLGGDAQLLAKSVSPAHQFPPAAPLMRSQAQGLVGLPLWQSAVSTQEPAKGSLLTSSPSQG